MGRFGRPLIAVCFFLVAVAAVRAQETCSITQITNATSGSSLDPSIDAAGKRIAFSSNADPLGSNGDGSYEIFLWDAATGFTQITNINSPFILTPRINGAGNRIAFYTDADPLGSNGDRSYEIFLWDAATGLTQITNSTGRDRLFPAINASGTRIAFQVDAADLFGDVEIFLWDASTGLTQITNTSNGISSGASINAVGNRIAYSFSPVLASGIDNIFLWDASTGFAQITQFNSFMPAIDAAGNRIAFYSNSNQGNSGDENDEIFLWDASTGFTQITNTTKGNNIFPVINATGTRIAFQSNADLLGNNGNGNFQIFLSSCQPLLAPAVPAVSPIGLGILAVLLGLAAAWTLGRHRG